ncbi:spermidine synthase [Paenibacillus sp. TAB 01]|uniref:spermidine synthase n=1 Tax=Paenibacillus sp. TAB 01 TaxID=3368988 RepID=UPI003752FDAC
MHLLAQHSEDGQSVSVYDTEELYGEKGNFRILKFSDNAVQGAMDLNDPRRVVFEYPRAIIHLMEHNNPDFERGFIIGHGIGTIARYFSRKWITAAELNEAVAAYSRDFFGYTGDNVIVGDGREVLSREKAAVHDYIFVDAFTEKGTPLHLISKQFFLMAKEKLQPEGYLFLNLMGRGEQDSRIGAIHTTLTEVYRYTKAFALPQGSVHDVKNMILAAGNRPIAFQARQLAGFIEVEPAQGYVLTDEG